MNVLTQKLRVIMKARNVFVSTIYNLPRPTADVKVNQTTGPKGHGYLLKIVIHPSEKKKQVWRFPYVEII